MEERKISLLTLCDLSKALDSVYHNILNKNLTKINVKPFWFQDHLDNRCQKFKKLIAMSTAALVKYGVPQGSVLEPILFTIFINDPAEEIHGCEIIQYANDTQFVHTSTVDALPHLSTTAQVTLSGIFFFFFFFYRNGSSSRA